jgi:hypothetical protein
VTKASFFPPLLSVDRSLVPYSKGHVRARGEGIQKKEFIGEHSWLQATETHTSIFKTWNSLTKETEKRSEFNPQYQGRKKKKRQKILKSPELTSVFGGVKSQCHDQDLFCLFPCYYSQTG